MADKKIIVKKNGKVIIVINQRELIRSSKKTVPAERKGIIRSRRPVDFFPRRLQKPSGMKFYDLSQVLIEGLPTDINFSVPRVLTYANGSDSLTSTVPTLDDFRALETLVIGDGAETLIDRFWQIDQPAGQYFNVFVLGGGEVLSAFRTSENWRENATLVLTPEQLASSDFTIVPPFPFFYGLTLSGAYVDHITSEYDPDADAAEFAPGANDIYFLMPSIAEFSALATWQETGQPPVDQRLVADFQPFRRREVLDEENYFFYLLNFITQWSEGDDPEEYYGAYEAIDFIKTYGLNRQALQLDFPMPSPYIWSVIDPDDFPNTAIFPTDPPPAPAAFNLSTVIANANTFPKILKAVIKQGSQFFYVWQQ